jgi:hypothetical protein
VALTSVVVGTYTLLTLHVVVRMKAAYIAPMSDAICTIFKSLTGMFEDVGLGDDWLVRRYYVPVIFWRKWSRSRRQRGWFVVFERAMTW